MARKPAHEQFDTLQAIENTAFELFGRYGYDGVSIGDIAKAAKLSKGALYWHFDGKEELYLDCLKRLHTIFNDYIFEPMRGQSDPAAAVVDLFAGLQQLLKDPRVENGVAGYWLVPSRQENSALTRAQRDFETSSIATLRDVLHRGVEARQLDFGGDLDDMARAIISLVEACVLPMRHQGPDEVRGILAVLARTLFRAYARSGDVVKLTDRL
ncbi:TetR/AcrR family transcriptional regulator [Sinimarinibacterium sp. CAU 1509]|uniref:TetR/AcrR family transcriptional regulator n=1 Tax=Sinimarinibacterium sp. CAU 1509 TaxID=2562283 RepID=UPI0010AC0616|nr:TetR/AcrR family transcriptional regulator [Sinimarinibacterium sp. CAU 1509]TJY60801.1 TetR/AcrR family transcriptional regulator [Sinimarinibacterium sp. CAU 1509]